MTIYTYFSIFHLIKFRTTIHLSALLKLEPELETLKSLLNNRNYESEILKYNKMLKRCNSEPIFWIPDSKTYRSRKSKNQVVLDDRFQSRSKDSYSQHKVLIHKSSLYKKLDKGAVPAKLEVTALGFWDGPQILPMSGMKIKQSKRCRVKLEHLLVPFI